MKRLVCLAAVASALFGVLAPSATAGTIEGTVTPAEWAQEVEVCSIGVTLNEWCAAPKADGTYVYPGVFGTVTFEFIPTYRSNLLPQFFDHKRSLSEAKFIEVGPNTVKGVDADLLKGGSISGLVASSGVGGVPIPEVEVCAADFSPPQPDWKSCDETDANGEYLLHSLPSGLYKVGFWGQAGSAEYEPTYYPDRPSFAGALPIEVTAGQTKTGIDAALVKGGEIAGQVFADAGGAPLGDIAVCLFADAEANPRRCVATGDDGSYAFQGLASGSYQVGFSLEASKTGDGGAAAAGADAFESEYYANVPTRAQATTISLLAPGEAEAIDAHLSALSTAPPLTMATPSLSTPPSTSIAVVPEPASKVARCKKPKHRVRVAGTVRCVKPGKHGKSKKRGKGNPAKSD